MCLKQWISRRFCCCQGFNRRIVAMKKSWDEVSFLLMTASKHCSLQTAEKANSPSLQTFYANTVLIQTHYTETSMFLYREKTDHLHDPFSIIRLSFSR